MPCRDWDENVRVVYQDRVDTRKVDDLTARLCRIYTVLEKEGLKRLIPNMQDVEWWERHKDMDRKRKIAEAQAVKEQIARLERDLAKARAKLR